MNYHLSNYASTLRTWVNVHYPHRDKTSDGWIGDLAHSHRVSDHNPDDKGVVRAIDIDADLVPGAKDRSEAARLAETLRLDAKAGRRPITYIIHAGKICSPKQRWVWRPYTGVNAHMHHIHISFAKKVGE